MVKKLVIVKEQDHGLIIRVFRHRGILKAKLLSLRVFRHRGTLKAKVSSFRVCRRRGTLNAKLSFHHLGFIDAEAPLVGPNHMALISWLYCHLRWVYHLGFIDAEENF